MQLLDYQEILPHEIDLLSSQGVSLANFADRNSKKNIFTKIESSLESDHHQFRMVNIVSVKNSVSSNLQALALAFLRCIFQNSTNSDLLDHIKCSLYNKNFIFSKLQNVQLQSLSDISIKKMLAQFFQLLTFGNCQNKVLVKLAKYPIIIELAVCYFRVILSFLEMQQALNGKNKLQTQQIYENLLEFFDINYKLIDGIYLFLDDGVFINFKDQQFFVGDFIQNIKKKSQPSEDGCSSDEQLIAFVRPNDIQKNIMAINQIDQDFSEQQIGNSTPSFFPTQNRNFQKKRNSNQQQFIQDKNQSSTPSFARINKEEINFKPKIKINQCPAIKQCQNQDDLPPQVRIRTRTIDVTHFWEGNMHDSQGSGLFESNHESVVDAGGNPQSSKLLLLDKSYRIHCEQKASKPETPPPLIHKRNKSQHKQKIFNKVQYRNQVPQKKDIKPPPSFLFTAKKNQSPQKIEKKKLLQVVKQQKKMSNNTNSNSNKSNNNSSNKEKEKWLPFMYNKKKGKNSSYYHEKGTSQIFLQKKTSLNYNNNNKNNTSNSYQKVLTSSRQNQCANVCNKCTRRYPKNAIRSEVVSICINPILQKNNKLPFRKTSHSPSPKKMNSLANFNDLNFMKKCYEYQPKIYTNASDIYTANNNQALLITSSPNKTNSPKAIYTYPKQFVNRSNKGRTSAIYPPNSMYC